ncbi:hypothetical protein BKD03_17025 [Brucella sp. 09RB8471]|nr:hypothetical protein BKD03_17025 [Brucella sp. 09RB8471]
MAYIPVLGAAGKKFVTDSEHRSPHGLPGIMTHVQTPFLLAQLSARIALLQPLLSFFVLPPSFQSFALP